MKVETKSAIEALTEKNSACLGAAFCTFTLDTKFLEEKVLPELLDIRSDPQEQASRFLEEARSRLREVPVVCIADGSVYRGGHRLPFDLLLGSVVVNSVPLSVIIASTSIPCMLYHLPPLINALPTSHPFLLSITSV